MKGHRAIGVGGGATPALALILALVASPASASRAELDGRGLPRLLADDPTNIPIFPGCTAGFPSMLLVDYAGQPTYTSLDPSGLAAPSDRFAAALFGRGVRFAYLVDGETHHLVLGLPRGFGFGLGFSDQYNEGESNLVEEIGYRVDVASTAMKLSETRIRASLGWSGNLGDRRTLSLAAAASYLDSEFRGDALRVIDGDTTLDLHRTAVSDPGIGWEVSLQSLAVGTGFLVAAHYSDRNRNPSGEGFVPDVWRSRIVSLDLGWRLIPEPLDDFVFGWTSSWSEEESPTISSYYSDRLIASEEDLYQGGLFASGEKRILKALVARGGVLARGYFRERVLGFVDKGEFGESVDYSRTSTSTGRVESPRIFLGGSWSWKRLRVDAYLRENLSLTDPFLRWAASMTW